MKMIDVFFFHIHLVLSVCPPMCFFNRTKRYIYTRYIKKTSTTTICRHRTEDRLPPLVGRIVGFNNLGALDLGGLIPDGSTGAGSDGSRCCGGTALANERIKLTTIWPEIQLAKYYLYFE